MIAPTLQVDRPLIWVEKGSLEYQLFVQRIVDNQQDRTNKRQVCVPCWAFISVSEKGNHLEHKDLIFNSFCIRDELSFLKMASDYGRTHENKVAILNNKCIFAEAVLEDGSNQYSVLCEPQGNIRGNNSKVLVQPSSGYVHLDSQDSSALQGGNFNHFSYGKSPAAQAIIQAFANDIYEDAGSDIQETLAKVQRQNTLNHRRCLFSPALITAPNPEVNPFAILGKEDSMSTKLGDATADDIIFLAKRTKKLREKMRELKEVVDLVFDLTYCGKSADEVGKKFLEDQDQRQEKIKEHVLKREQQRKDMQNLAGKTGASAQKAKTNIPSGSSGVKT